MMHNDTQAVCPNQPFFDATSISGNTKVKIYPHADHGYTWRGWPSYNEAA